MNYKYIFVFLFLIIYSVSFCQESKFLAIIKEPIHHTPNHYPETYDQKGYTKLLDTLIRWEMTRSMYDWKFGLSLGQIKSLSRITHSEYGMAMFHYFEGIRRGLGDPLNAENDFLKALEYFEVHKDTSGILHTSMHLFRLSLNTAFLDYGVLIRYYDLYQKVLDKGAETKNPLDQVIHLRNKILYDEYFCGEKNVSYYTDEIEEGLNIIQTLDGKYDYYKFLMLNTVGIIYSKSIKTVESEYYHSKAFEIIQKYPSRELLMAAYRLAAMKYDNGKYEECLRYLSIFRKYNGLHLSNFTVVPNPEALAYFYRLSSQCFTKIGDTKNAEKNLALSYVIYNLELPKQKYLLYMKNMATLHKNEENTKVILENERKQAKLNVIIVIIIIVAIVIVAVFYSRLNSITNKKLQKDILKRDFIYSMIGHDLSSPLLAMDNTLNHIELTLKESLTPSQKNYISLLKPEIKGAHFLLLNLLHWYKSDIDLAGYNLDKELINIKINVNQSVQHLFFRSNENPIKFINNCQDNINFNLNVVMFHSVIRNIVDNAIKHSGCNTITVTGSIENEKLIVTIHDNGDGMDPKFIHFFNQAKSIFDLKNSEVKIGLGTIFILEFAKSMNSKIQVKSNKEGTTYYWEINN
jgi:signal transduction histidine kinase